MRKILCREKSHLNEEIWTFDVDIVDLVNVVLGRGFEIFHHQDAGVRDEDVDLAKVPDGGLDHGLDTGDTACIRLDSNGAVAANLFYDLVGGGRFGSLVDCD